MKNLIWFRSDLRLEDNPALLHACRDSAEAPVAVFLLAHRQWLEHDWGTRKVAYLMRNLESLRRGLANLGIPLLIEEAPDFSDAPVVLDELVERHECQALYFNREYEFNEAQRDRRVETRLRDKGIEVRSFDDQTILAPGTVQTGAGEPYKVFTPFWRTWSRHVETHPPRVLPKPEARSDKIDSDLQLPESVGPYSLSRHSDTDWTIGEQAAQEALEAFLAQSASAYQQNRDSPASEGTSRLSAALALGVLSPRSCLRRAVEANHGRLSDGDEGIEAWIRQLAWRDFYRQVTQAFPRVSRSKSFQAWADRIEWRQSADEFDAWREGRTGVPLVDAGMRQLRQTGWLHNRVRMVTAMYLTKDLLLDWRLGEAHFMRQLVDGDFANNNGGWQWSASTGVDAAPYFRIMNPWTQASRFDPKGDYIKAWVPELVDVPAATLHDPKKLAALIHAGHDYAEPLVAHKAARIRAINAFERAKQLSTA